MTSAVKSELLDPHVDQKREFAIWSQAYDELPNPLLSLEQRLLAPLFRVRGKDLLDVGCGTGRWLEQLSASEPLSLTGVDFSPEMLDRAKQKLGRGARLAVGNATSLPLASSSADVVIASFVASYVGDLAAFAAELHRVARSDSRIYISDVHPETAASCGWKRGFRDGHRQIELTTHPYSLSEIISCCRSAGLQIRSLLEPPFGVAELQIFRAAGKAGAFHAAAGMPAIYVLELEPVTSPAHIAPRIASTMRLRNARIALDAEASVNADMAIGDGRVSSIVSGTGVPANGGEGSPSVDLAGYLLLPGLINAHDHLEFGLYPNLGRGPYQNSTEWARGIQENEKATIATHQSVPRDVRSWWGAIRNLLCGVTTVCHHNALHPELLAGDFPIRLVTDYGWAHSLALDNQVDAKFESTSTTSPFILHACEGLDRESQDEIFRLDHIGALDDRTVLVHGLGLGREGIALLNERGAALVWCPSSNRFLFGKTHTRQDISSIRRVLLGSDSPLTATGDLLDEVRIAHCEVGLPESLLYQMVTRCAAEVLRLRDGQGMLREGGTADLIAVRETGRSPAETVANMTAADVELVVVRGQVKLASNEIYARLPGEASLGLQPLEVNSTLRWIRAPLGRLFREVERVLGNDIKIGGRRVRHVCTAWL